MKIDYNCGLLRDVRGIVIQIATRMGSKQWRKLDSKTRYQLIGMEMKYLREDMIRVYGSSSAYEKHWLKQKGMRKIDYCNEIARRHGYKNQKEYLDKRYQLKGFKNKCDRDRFYRLRKKYHKRISDFKVREVQLMKEKREVQKELKEFIIIRQSMRNKLSCKTQKEWAVKSLETCESKSRRKMTTENKVKGVKPSIHPTIGVCGKPNGGVMIRMKSLQTERIRGAPPVLLDKTR